MATLLATLPGLPMFGHGQFEGFAEKYGMEFRRASMDEQPDRWLIERHEREIVPLLHRRGDFAEAHNFLLYDVAADGGGVDEHVFAYSNGSGPSRSLVVYHNRYAETSGWIRDSVAFALKAGDGSKSTLRRTLAEGLGLANGPAEGRWLAMREQRSGLEYLRSVGEIRERGVHVSLQAYDTRVFWELRELSDAAGVWARLAERLGGRGVPSLEGALRELELTPVHDALRAVIAEPTRAAVGRLVAAVADATGTKGDEAAVVDLVAARHASIEAVVATIDDPSQESAMRLWTLLAPLGSLPAGADVGATSRAWYEELRLAPVVADGLRDRGLDEAGAWWAAERIRMLLALALPSQLGGRVATLPSRLVDAWFADPSVRAYPARQPLGRRRLVPPRVMDGAPRLVRSTGAGADAVGRAGPEAGRALGPVTPPRGRRRGVRLPGRGAARGAGGTGDAVCQQVIVQAAAPQGHRPPARPQGSAEAPGILAEAPSLTPRSPPLERDKFTAMAPTTIRHGAGSKQTRPASIRLDLERRPFRPTSARLDQRSARAAVNVRRSSDQAGYLAATSTWKHSVVVP